MSDNPPDQPEDQPPLSDQTPPPPPPTAPTEPVTAETEIGYGMATDIPPTTNAPTASAKRPGAGLLVIAVLVSALLGGLVGGLIVRSRDNGSSTSVNSSGARVTQVVTTSDIKSVLKEVEPAVVSIYTNGVGVGQLGSGSGVLITKEGQVLTNAHVVSGGNSFSVSLYNSPDKLPADLVGIDASQDLALLRIRNSDNRTFPVAQFGDSDAIEVGDPVIAIGNALGLSGGPSVTTGIISAKNRSISSSEQNGSGQETLSGLLQTDAAINFGNSGGPLVNLRGQVIGINTATADPSYSQNVGFAIAINNVKPVLEDLRDGKNNEQQQALLGVTAFTVTDDVRQRYSFITVDKGAVVESVQQNSPASQLGLKAGDVIVAVDGEAVTSSESLVSIVRKHKPGDKVKVEWIRNGDRQSGTVELVGRAVGSTG